MRVGRWRRFVGPSVVAGMVACGPGEVREVPLWTGPLEPGERTFLKATWDTVWSVGGEEDTLLLDPRFFRVWEGGLVIWDSGASQLHALDPEGRHAWSVGGPGQGPDEFSIVADLEVDAQGRSYLLDRENARISTVSPDGRIEGAIPLGILPHVNAMGLVSDTLLVLVATGETEDPVWVVDLDGRPVERRAMPWPGFGSLHAVSRQGRVASEGDRWVYAFLVANGWFAFEGLRPTDYLGGFVEHLDLPRLVSFSRGRQRTTQAVEAPPSAALEISLSDSVVTFLFEGLTEKRRRLLDLHHWEDGSYLGSYLLPGEADRAVYRDGLVYVLSTDPYPRVTVLEPRARR